MTYFGNFPNEEYWSFIPAVGNYALQEVSLQSQWWNVSTWGASRFALPTLRGQDYEQPYRAGMQWRSKMPNSRVCTLAMWTAAISQLTGNPDTVNTKLTFNNNFNQLRQMFWQRAALGSAQSQLRRRWYITQGGSAQTVVGTAMAEIAGSMEPAMNNRFSASFAVDLLLSDPYFYGTSQSQTISSSGSITNLGEGVVGEGYPSSVNAFTIQITTGPCTVTNQTAGVSVTFNAPVANSPVTLDVLNQTATDALGNNLIGNVSHSGARMWMCLLPGANTIQVSAGQATFGWSPPYV